MVQGDRRPEAGVSRRLEDLAHVRHAPVGFGHTLHAVPDFAALGNEVVVGSITRRAVLLLRYSTSLTLLRSAVVGVTPR